MHMFSNVHWKASEVYLKQKDAEIKITDKQ